MKKLNKILIAILLPLIFACTTDTTSFEIVVKGGEHFPEDAEVVITRRRLDSLRKVETLVKERFTNGVLSYKGKVESIHSISFSVRSVTDGKSGSPIILMALEPGTTEITFSSTNDYTFKGGKYSEMLINPVINDAAYQKAEKAFNNHKVKDFSIKDTVAFNEYYRLVGISSRARGKVLKQVYEQQNDPLAKLLLHNSGYYTGDHIEAMKTKEELASQLVDNREAVLTKLQNEAAKKTYAIRATLDVGKTIKEFAADNLEGENIQLSEVLKKNKYVLVELWASWCAPCRAEIPHMKRAYEAFHKKGFEIVSFSLDEKRKDWENASIKEDIPWINISDVMGYESPVAKMFAQPAVPANWLVDASTGKIIANHVRGKALDNKLEELLN
ncbi:TlpA family protein disulfide reductase [Seonamhaeicola maritimus]|uniref:TlpA family protein disulfide reductase n=1 Tax=Seonamhaeicola maritimus TaxID=2591822 RepID=UPI002493EEC5|nr:TlpA disulfide reductase family protein [Seonamhaeicola maritimus]